LKLIDKRFFQLRIIMFLFFIFNMLVNLKFGGVFPSFVFPHFPNHSKGNANIPYVRVDYSVEGVSYNIMELVKPYDYRFYLFFHEFAGKEKYSEASIIFLNKVYKNRFPESDTIQMVVTQNFKDLY
jgi:hypothetical protein